MIYFRADGNEMVGSGHVMRSITIAGRLRKLGKTCVFVLADKTMQPQVAASGFESICLDSSWNDLEQETDQFCRLIFKTKPEAILLDSYFATENYLKALSSGARLAYMDDELKFFKHCSLMICYLFGVNQAEYSAKYAELSPETELLVGPGYAPLREEFKNSAKTQTNKVVRRVLVTAGGADEFNISGAIAEVLCGRFPGLEFNLVVGGLNPNLGKLKALAKRFKNLNLRISVTNMAKLMQESDIAISAGGNTLEELCACRVPSICFSFADNQKSTRWLGRHGFVKDAGDFRADPAQFFNRLALAFEELANSAEQRESYWRKLEGLVDGLGADRIAGRLMELAKKPPRCL